MRILFLSGYTLPSHHRKVELLANAPDIDILHILQPGSGKEAGEYLSENGLRKYRVEVLPDFDLGQPGDVHRTIHWPPYFRIRHYNPHIIHCEHEQEGLKAAEVALARSILVPRTPLILYSWQNILRKRKLHVRLACTFTLRSAQHIMCASTEAVNVLLRQNYSGTTSVMPLHGLDTRFFYPKDVSQLYAELKLQGFVVGFIGRLVPEKGIDTLLRAVALATSKVQLLILGSGPEKERLQNLADDLGIANCRFIEKVDNDLVVDYMNLLDLLVLPSRTTPHWKEQFGRVLTEAMACKVVVAGSNSGAIPEVIGNAGRIFPEGDSIALARIINELADNQDLCRVLGQQGYERVLENYTIEILVDKILNCWHELPINQEVVGK